MAVQNNENLQPCVYHDELRSEVKELSSLLTEFNLWRAVDSERQDRLISEQEKTQAKVDELKACFYKKGAVFVTREQCSSNLDKYEEKNDELRSYIDGQMKELKKMVMWLFGTAFTAGVFVFGIIQWLLDKVL